MNEVYDTMMIRTRTLDQLDDIRLRLKAIEFLNEEISNFNAAPDAEDDPELRNAIIIARDDVVEKTKTIVEKYGYYLRFGIKA